MPNHPIELGQKMNGGTVIAWGYYTDQTLSVMTLLDEENRIPNEKNYSLFHVDLMDGNGSLSAPFRETFYPNINPATWAYADEYGLDY